MTAEPAPPKSTGRTGLGVTAEDLEPRDFGRLPFTAQEAVNILRMVPEDHSLQALAFEATKERFLSADLGRYRIVHVASHGILNSKHPELSGLVFSSVACDGQRRDPFLLAFEISSLELAADLVVLSACSTAFGKVLRGEGMLGMTRSFMTRRCEQSSGEPLERRRSGHCRTHGMVLPSAVDRWCGASCGFA